MSKNFIGRWNNWPYIFLAFNILLANIYLIYLRFNIIDIYFHSILGSTIGKFTEVSVSGCSLSDERCVLVRGTNASISITFTPSEYENYV